jgi:CubicO group peptidase (beta-lactamase class C family)
VARQCLDLSPYGRITSVVVSKGREIVHAQYLEGDAQSLRNTRSCTKTILSVIVGAAIRRGLIEGTQVTVADLMGVEASSLEEDPRKSSMTVRDLLTMTSCLECDDSDPRSAGNEERMYPREDWVEFALGLPIRSGRGFSYCTAGVVALGVATARALGQPLSEFAAREIFAPIGIESFDWPKTPSGDDSAAGGVCLSSRSLLQLVHLYLDGGGSIVSADWVRDSTTAQTEVDERTGYGYLWWLREYEGRRSYYMAGAGGSHVHAFPDDDLAVAVTSANFGVSGAHDLTERLLVEQILPRFG